MFLQDLHYLWCILMKCTSVLLQWVVFILRWQWALCVLCVAYTNNLYYILTYCWLTLILYWSASFISSLHNNSKSLLSPPLRRTAGLFWTYIVWCYLYDVCLCVVVYWVENLAKLFSQMDQNSPERVAFVSRALKWSTGGSSKLGHPKLHQLLAVTLWKGNL